MNSRICFASISPFRHAYGRFRSGVASGRHARDRDRQQSCRDALTYYEATAWYELLRSADGRQPQSRSACALDAGGEQRAYGANA
jgi:hypothetical protein